MATDPSKPWLDVGFSLTGNPFFANQQYFGSNAAIPEYYQLGNAWYQNQPYTYNMGDSEYTGYKDVLMPEGFDPSSLTYMRENGDQQPFETPLNMQYDFGVDFNQLPQEIRDNWSVRDSGNFLRDSMGYTQFKVVDFDPETGTYLTMTKSGDKEGTVQAWAPDENGNMRVVENLGTTGWDTNKNVFEQSSFWPLALMAVAGAGMATSGAGAAGAAGGAGGAGATEPVAAGAAGGGATLPSLSQLWNGLRAGAGGLGAANTISRLFTGSPIVGDDGHLFDSGGNVDTNTGGLNDIPVPGGSPLPGGGGIGGGLPWGDLLSLFLQGGLTAAGADRQENFSDQLLSMYNEQKAKAAPWEQMLAESYTPEGQQAILSSPQFMSQQGTYKQMLDRNAAKAGTLTNTMSGIPGIAPRGREAALQKFGYDYMNDYRKQPMSMVDLYTKNANDYKLLAAMGLATEAAAPANWSNFLSQNSGNPALQALRSVLNNPQQATQAVDSVLAAGGSIQDWWTDLLGRNGVGEDVSNLLEDPGGDIISGNGSFGLANDPMFDALENNPLWGGDAELNSLWNLLPEFGEG